MSTKQDQIQPGRYFYRLKLEPQQSKRDEEGKITQKELQAFIDQILGTSKDEKA